ncbi:Reverse transcriptase [Phytophthora palmivora]|uniref:Reverse transcriptase n=1 Tax=Phytophthora palmivora TaxID=4796 RepID=A0A2P4XVT6_9STRA|nr:Reverse transcriptase [Phytophthora palmivora]
MCRAKKINMANQMAEDDHSKAGDDYRWTTVRSVYTVLKAKIITTPILRHIYSGRTQVVVLFMNKWAISAALMQGRLISLDSPSDVGRMLHPIDRAVNKVLARYTAPVWLLNSAGFDGRLGKWVVLSSGWILEITKCSKEEVETFGAIAASITPRAEVEEALVPIAPTKQPRKPSLVRRRRSDRRKVASSRTSKGGAFGAIVWKLPEWSILETVSDFREDVTVNEAEYRGLLLFFDPLSTQDRQ